jgi:hypothetical protein
VAMKTASFTVQRVIGEAANRAAVQTKYPGTAAGGAASARLAAMDCSPLWEDRLIFGCQSVPIGDRIQHQQYQEQHVSSKADCVGTAARIVNVSSANEHSRAQTKEALAQGCQWGMSDEQRTGATASFP